MKRYPRSIHEGIYKGLEMAIGIFINIPDDITNNKDILNSVICVRDYGAPTCIPIDDFKTIEEFHQFIDYIQTHSVDFSIYKDTILDKFVIKLTQKRH